MEPCELNCILLKEFPQLKNTFEEETSWQEGIATGSTVVFEDVFMPFAFEIMAHGDKKEIDHIFDFIETLSNVNDEYVHNVLTISVIDNFKHSVKPAEFESYLRENSKRLYFLY